MFVFQKVMEDKYAGSDCCASIDIVVFHGHGGCGTDPDKTEKPNAEKMRLLSLNRSEE